MDAFRGTCRERRSLLDIRGRHVEVSSGGSFFTDRNVEESRPLKKRQALKYALGNAQPAKIGSDPKMLLRG